MPTFDCPPPAAAGKIHSPASQDRQAGKNSLPLKPLSFLPACFGRAWENFRAKHGRKEISITPSS